MSKFSNIVNKILVEHLLIEGIEEVKPYFPNIPEKSFIQIINLDPTYTGGNSLGKYGKWLLTRYNQLFKKNPNVELDADLKKELTIYDKFKANIEKDFGKKLDQIKSFDELLKITNEYKNKEVTLSNRQQKRNIKSEAKKIYDKDGWLIIIPKTEEASCYYGANTKWCTAAKNDNRFDQYDDQGPLYIIIDTNTGNKWQFHFGEDEDTFADAKDHYLEDEELEETIKSFPKDLQKFFIKLAKSKLSFTFLDALSTEFTDKEIATILNKKPYLFYSFLDRGLSDEIQYYVAKNFPDMYIQNIERFSPRYLFFLEDPTYQKLAMEKSLEAVNLIKKFSPEVQPLAIKEYPHLLAAFPEKFDPKYRIKAKNPIFVTNMLKQYPSILKYMKNPNIVYQKIALENNPTLLYQAKDILSPKLKNNTKYQIAALQATPFNAHRIDNLTPEAISFLKDFNPVQYQIYINRKENQAA